MFKKILVAVDGSKTSNRAVVVAVDLAKCYQSEIFLLHVIRNLSLPREILQMIAAGEITQSRRELLEDSADMMLDNAKEEFAKAGITNVHAEYTTGDPSNEIRDYIIAKEIDLLILGDRGFGDQDNMLGGVARKITNISPVSCLIVKDE